MNVNNSLKGHSMNSVHPLSFVAVAPDIIIPMMSLALQEKNLRVWLLLENQPGHSFHAI